VTTTQAFVAGLAAGLAVAVPLGAVGTLVLDLGLRHGARTALAAGMGVATVDGLYAAAAAAFGASLAAALAPAQDAIRLVAAAVLAAVALLLLRAALARRTQARTVAAAAPTPAPPRKGVLYARFVGLTSVNPTTAATFAAVTAGLPAAGGDDLAAAAAAAFVLGAFGASAAWHAALATASGAAGRRLPEHARAWTGVAGAALVLALAARLALG